MSNAPNGAVIRIASTAMVKMICLDANPIANGSGPMAACTVAFGVYATMQKSRSLIFSCVLSRPMNTLAIRNIIAPKIKITAEPTVANA